MYMYLYIYSEFVFVLVFVLVFVFVFECLRVYVGMSGFKFMCACMYMSVLVF